MLGKKSLRRITVPEMAPHVHSFSQGENKVDKISKWLISWIEAALSSGKIVPYDFLPTKADLACHIGVSLGTMQNVFRQLEDLGYLESKQRVGTFIKDKKKNPTFEKLTSKKEYAVEVIKKHIAENNYSCNQTLVSTRKLATITGLSATTLRTAMVHLVNLGILSKKEKSFIVKNSNFTVKQVQTKTLTQKTAEHLESYINQNLKAGDKLPTNIELSQKFNTSIKTIHDAIKILSKKGILYSRRGKYGTIVIDNSSKANEELYYYEKIAQKISHYISENHKIGDKIPSIVEFSKEYNVSPKTVKKALDNLAEDGFITFARGRHGGTFVTDIPQNSKEAYTWLALNSEYFSNTENS